MISARKTALLGLELSQSALPRLIKGKSRGPVFKRDISDGSHMSFTPLMRDPHEERTVEVRKSSIAKAGQGVFLTRSVPANTIVTYFNGVRAKEKEIFADASHRKSVYLVEIGEEDDYLDVPKEYANWDKYECCQQHSIYNASPVVATKPAPGTR